MEQTTGSHVLHILYALTCASPLLHNKGIKMQSWRHDVRRELEILRALITSTPQASEYPLYVLERILEQIPELMRSNISPKDVRTMVLGAFRASADAGASSDDDPVTKQLFKVEAALPNEGDEL